VGKHTECPSTEALEVERKDRAARREREVQRAEAEAARKNNQAASPFSSAAFTQLGLEADKAEAATAEAAVLLSKVKQQRQQQRGGKGDGDDDQDIKAEMASLFASVDKLAAESGAEKLKKKNQGTYYRTSGRGEASKSTTASASPSASSKPNQDQEDEEELLADLVATLEAQGKALRRQQAALAAELSRLSSGLDQEEEGSGGRVDNGSGGGGGDATPQKQMEAKARLADLSQRARLAVDGYAKTHPYETLGLLREATGDDQGGGGDDENDGVGGGGISPGRKSGGHFHASTRTVTQGHIRSAYRKLSLKLHPDKVQGANLCAFREEEEEEEEEKEDKGRQQ